MADAIYTIGHSTHPIERFTELLRMHGITALCDVRSRPYSRMNPQFNREELKDVLNSAGIKYVFLGKELGARTDDRSCYRHGQVQYSLLAQTNPFKKGIDRVIEGSRQYRVALMCAEKEPLDCHRTILVARVLTENGVPATHILSDGQLETQAHAIERLIVRLRTPGADMFREQATVIADAYAQQGHQIAYREESAPDVDGSQAAE